MNRVATTDGVTEAVLRAAGEVFPSYDHAAFWSLGPHGSVGPHSSTSVLALDLDTASAAEGEGPTLDSMRSGAVVGGSWMARNESWPVYGPRAARSGVRAQLSVPLPRRPDDQTTDDTPDPPQAISLFSTNLDVVTAGDIDLARVFALHAATAMGWALEADAAARLAARRELVARACGILEERYQVDERGAHGLLLRTAHARGATVDLVAGEITAELGRHATRSQPTSTPRRTPAMSDGAGDRAGDAPAVSRAVGWYRDETNSRAHRYWTGDRWRTDDANAPPAAHD